MHACTDTHKGGHYSCAHSYSESGWAPPLARIQTYAHTTHAYTNTVHTPWNQWHPYWDQVWLFLHASLLINRIIFLPIPPSSSSLPPVAPRPPSRLFPSVPVCPCASSQSVSEKCCCQLTFPITPLVSQSMDTLLTSGDRADREWHLKQSTRATSLPHTFIQTCHLSI